MKLFMLTPPWKYSNTMPEYITDQEMYYSTMSISELCELDISEITEDRDHFRK